MCIILYRGGDGSGRVDGDDDRRGNCLSPWARRFCRDTRQNPCHRVHDYDYGHDEDEDDEKKGAHTHSLTRVLYIAVYIYTCGRACVTDDGMSNYYS